MTSRDFFVTLKFFFHGLARISSRAHIALILQRSWCLWKTRFKKLRCTQQNLSISRWTKFFRAQRKKYEKSFHKKLFYVKNLSKISPSLPTENRFFENRKILSFVELHGWTCFQKFISTYCKTLYTILFPKRHKNEKLFSPFRYHPAFFAENLDPIGLKFDFVWGFEDDWY